MPKRLRLAAFCVLLAAFGLGCGDSEGNDAGPGDLNRGTRDVGFIFADLGVGDAQTLDAQPPGDATPSDSSSPDATPEAGVDAGRDAGSGLDANDICTNGPRMPADDNLVHRDQGATKSNLVGA